MNTTCTHVSTVYVHACGYRDLKLAVSRQQLLNADSEPHHKWRRHELVFGKSLKINKAGKRDARLVAMRLADT